MLRLVLLVFVTSAVAADLPMASTPIPPMASSPFPLFNPMKQQQFVSGSTPFIPNLTSNFSSPASSGTGASSVPSGSGASFVPPGYGIQQVFYPPAIFYPGMGGAYGSYPNFPSNLPPMNPSFPSNLPPPMNPNFPSNISPMNQNQPSLGLQGHASPVHQVPWYPTPASTCQGCNLIYRGLPYPGLVPNVQLPSNVPYVRNVPLEPLSQPLVNNWMPHNVQPLVQNLPNLYNPEPVPSPVSESVPLVPEPSSVVPEPSSVVLEPSSLVPVPELPPVVSLSPKEAVPEVVPKEVPSSSRQKRAVVFRSYGSYGYSSWPYYGYRSYLGGWPYYGYRSYYPYRSWYPYW